MRHIMVCISGWSGTGKDEAASRLVGTHGAVQTGLADPAKRHLADVYGFTEAQLFGPSAMRNAGDPRYPKNVVAELGLRVEAGKYVLDLNGPFDRFAAITVARRHGLKDLVEAASEFGKDGLLSGAPRRFTADLEDPRFSLSPREALQLYCEQLNNLHINTWIAKGVSDQATIASGGYLYTRMGGLSVDRSGHWNPRTSVVTCFADFRHIHEFQYARTAAGRGMTPVLVRVKRPSVARPPYQHRSEVEQTRVRDAAFDFVLDNSGTVADLHAGVDRIIAEVSSGGWGHKPWDPAHVLPEPGEGYTP